MLITHIAPSILHSHIHAHQVIKMKDGKHTMFYTDEQVNKHHQRSRRTRSTTSATVARTAQEPRGEPAEIPLLHQRNGISKENIVLNPKYDYISCFFCQGYVLPKSICDQHNSKTNGWILMIFSINVHHMNGKK